MEAQRREITLSFDEVRLPVPSGKGGQGLSGGGLRAGHPAEGDGDPTAGRRTDLAGARDLDALSRQRMEGYIVV
jgi:hypothetical protein